MAVTALAEENIIQNLLDAGCDEELIRSFMAGYRKGHTKDQLNKLAKHRKCILEKLHESQREIDCLDYLVYQIEKERI